MRVIIDESIKTLPFFPELAVPLAEVGDEQLELFRVLLVHLAQLLRKIGHWKEVQVVIKLPTFLNRALPRQIFDIGGYGAGLQVL